MVPILIGANRREDGTFGPGNNANPTGRPLGTSIKDEVRKYLQEHPLAKEDFLRDLVLKKRHETWKMLEGNPTNSTDITSKGEKIAINVISFDDYDSPQSKPE